MLLDAFTRMLIGNPFVELHLSISYVKTTEYNSLHSQFLVYFCNDLF